MKLIKPAWLLIGAVLLALVTLLYFRTQTVDLEAHSRIVEDLRLLKHADASLNTDILKTRDGLLWHYDTVTGSMKRLARLHQSLKSNLSSAGYGNSARFRTALEKTGELIGTKASLLEDFKSQNAILKNSTKHLPQVADDIFARPESDDFDLYLILVTGALVSDVLSYTKDPSPAMQTQIQDKIRYIQRVNSGYDGVLRQYFTWLIKHAQVILETQPVADRMVSRLTSLPLDQNLSALGALYESQHQAKMQRADYYRTYLYALVLILLVFVAYILLQLRASTEALKQTVEELNHQKFALDQHAIVSKTDKSGRITYANDKFLEISGYERGELIGQLHSIINSGFHDREFFEDLWRTIGRGNVWHGDIRNRAKTGDYYWVATTIVPFLDDRGEPKQYISIRTDITRRRQIEAALFQAKERAHVTLESIGDAVITVDKEGNTDYMNPVAERLAGLGNEAAKRYGNLLNIFDIVDEETKTPLSSPLEPCLKRGSTVTLSTQLLVNRIDGREFAVEITIAPMHDRDAAIAGAVLALHDVTTLRGMAKEISYQATHDALTGLTNRLEFERILERMYVSAKKLRRSHVLCFLDLDEFKTVNDTCGHSAGDELLKQLSSMLQEKIRGRDTLARIGGDEFAILLGECSIGKAQWVAQDLCDTIRDYRFGWEGDEFRIGVSIGLVEINAQSGDVTGLMRAADAACYAAKAQGRNCVHAYDPGGDYFQRRYDAR